jgi:hypothetical protein
MPAITLPRLRQQAALLANSFDQPDAFVRSLHHLLEFYADRTQRPGQAGEPAPLIQSYHVPPPVLRQILLELSPLAQVDPAGGLALCDRLWEEPFLEFRTLAASLLGILPAQPAGPILDRIERWGQQHTEARLSNLLVRDGLSRARKEEPQKVLARLKGWLASPDPIILQMGLQALLSSLSTESDENLPAYFRLLNPFIRVIPAGLRPDLLDVLHALARRSPKETAYFFQQTLEMPKSPDTGWLVRQCLEDFPPEIRIILSAASRAGEQTAEGR